MSFDGFCISARRDAALTSVEKFFSCFEVRDRSVAPELVHVFHLACPSSKIPLNRTPGYFSVDYLLVPKWSCETPRAAESASPKQSSSSSGLQFPRHLHTTLFCFFRVLVIASCEAQTECTPIWTNSINLRFRAMMSMLQKPAARKLSPKSEVPIMMLNI